MKRPVQVAAGRTLLAARLACKVRRSEVARRLGATAALAGAMACIAAPSRSVDEEAAAVLAIPKGYREWTLISVAREEGELDDIRAILGNDIAVQAYRAGNLPFPDGSIIARIAWSYDPSDENNTAFGRAQSFVAGSPKNGVQFMVKDSQAYASTGGWGFAHFDDGQPAGEARIKTCFACHEAIPERDLVFTRYSP